jgi:hypothetical protein
MASVRVTSACSGVPPGQKMTFPSMTSIGLRTRSGSPPYCADLDSLGGDHDLAALRYPALDGDRPGWAWRGRA